jgi:hypothetical protein
MVFIRNQQTQRWMDVTGEDVACWSDKRKYIENSAQCGFWATLGQLLLAGFCCLIMIGCGSTEVVSPEVAKRAEELSAPFAKQIEQQTQTLDTTLFEVREVRDEVKQNTTALAAIKSQIEALQVVSKTQPLGGDTKASPPESPAKADTRTPVKAATPGTSQSETLVELATRLYAQGVDTHMKTREQLEMIDAQLNGGAPVTGAFFQNNRTSAVTSQRSAVRFVPRGQSRFWGTTNQAGQACGSNGCY